MPPRSITHDDSLHPHLHSKHSPIAQGFMRRAQKFQRLTKPLKQLGARGVYVPKPGPNARGAVVDIRQGKPSTTGSHLRYLEQGKGVDGQDAEVFTAHGAAINQAAFAHRVKDDPHQWRLVLSPEGSERLDLKAYTQAYMLQMEKDLGTKLDYAAAIHHDIPDRPPHVHLVISGVDERGDPLYFTKDYLTQGFKHRAQTLGTDRLGPLEREALGPREQTPQRTLTRAEVEMRIREGVDRAQKIRERMTKTRGKEHGVER